MLTGDVLREKWVWVPVARCHPRPNSNGFFIPMPEINIGMKKPACQCGRPHACSVALYETFRFSSIQRAPPKKCSQPTYDNLLGGRLCGANRVENVLTPRNAA